MPMPPPARTPARSLSPAHYRRTSQGGRPALRARHHAEQIREAFYEALPNVDAPPRRVRLHFGAPKTGDEYVLRWAPGGVLQVTAAGVRKPDIRDKAFATAVFGIWLGDKPIQADIKRDLVARLGLTRR